jgi:hypothetical protein
VIVLSGDDPVDRLRGGATPSALSLNFLGHVHFLSPGRKAPSPVYQKMCRLEVNQSQVEQ